MKLRKSKLWFSNLRSPMKIQYDSMWFSVFANVVSIILNYNLGFIGRQTKNWHLKQHWEWTKTTNLCLILMCLIQYITDLVLCQSKSNNISYNRLIPHTEIVFSNHILCQIERQNLPLVVMPPQLRFVTVCVLALHTEPLWEKKCLCCCASL